MQRVGVLAAIAATASDTQTTSVEGLALRYVPPLRQKLPGNAVAPARLERYFSNLRLWKRYPEVAGGAGVPAAVELQDIWLSDPDLPSATGAVTPEVRHENAQLAVALQLVRARNYTRTDRGRVFARLTEAGGPKDFQVDPNLFRIKPGLGFVTLYALLEADGDFSTAALRMAFESLGRRFTRAMVADSLASFADRMGEDLRQARASRDRLQDAAELKHLAVTLRSTERKSGAQWGGGRTPDQQATVRLEPYVDLGLLNKPDRFTYEYIATDEQRAFFDSIASVPDLASFLANGIASSYQRAIGERLGSRLGLDDVWVRVEAAYEYLRSGLGYASFTEVVLLAVAQELDTRSGSYFEVSDGVEAIRRQQSRAPRKVRFTVRRGGGLQYMRLIGVHEG